MVPKLSGSVDEFLQGGFASLVPRPLPSFSLLTVRKMRERAWDNLSHA